MDALALLLSRLQFAFTASFEALHLATCHPMVFESG